MADSKWECEDGVPSSASSQHFEVQGCLRLVPVRHESVESKYAWQDLKQKKIKVSNSSFYIKSRTSREAWTKFNDGRILAAPARRAMFHAANAHGCVLDAMGASAGAAVGAFAGRALLAE
ncbi:hypothetical protein PHYSODRAFT_323716 [Phytophthora sojae]|uniref:Uncharacterized protein n=1 Tax=Phytophthora sojae (strain P6497) TaxID=1094619 RepID=G4YLE4_PHYSP|nr:hypothetical protein PHYSODRAFT_323716 [Phytophthora sojae]EGZ30318.1 hypothetical protein PHYSODRAFT_323716 [Phytophthora sojae]|eukprot:XP_009517593.1 hypothetical protein PHYSODRAFT_323716 [Phytophthora sojae]